MQLIDNGQCIPGKFHLRLQDAACLDSVTLADLQFMCDNFANTDYDWGFNCVFIAYFDLDPIPIHALKPRQWRSCCKADDLARWRQLLAEKAVGGWH